MQRTSSQTLRSLAMAAIISAAVFAAGLCRIADLDFWWHLRTGKLIVDERAIPHQDVYSYTALGREYVDHEWLFQVIQWLIYAASGPAGIAIAKCLVFSATFVLIALYVVRRQGVPATAAVGLVLLAIAGGVTRIIERPEMFSTLFTVVTFILLDRFRESENRRFLIALPFLCVLWANIHAAVIVGLVVQGAFIVAAFFEKREHLKPIVITFVASIVAACFNPVTYRVLTVPFELTRIINSGVINNAEWRRPEFYKAPFFFACVALTIVLLASGFKRVGIARLLIGAFLAFISLRYIRNIGLFCTFTPLLVAPEIARWRREGAAALAAAGTAALLFIVTLYYPFQRGIGEASYFPRGIVRFVQDNDLEGRMLNSYGFGGYLIWRLFPERLVFIDGRNEVYLPLLERLRIARRDSREWSRLLRDYQIDYALLEYVDDLEKVSIVGTGGRVTVAQMPVTASKFPRSRWALVYWDDVGMIFVRRAGANAAVVSKEYSVVVPEGRGYLRSLVETGVVSRDRAISELERKLAEDPSCRRARVLLASIRSTAAVPP